MNLSVICASRGRISVTWMPGTLVAIGLNDAPDVIRDVLLGVPEVEVARARPGGRP